VARRIDQAGRQNGPDVHVAVVGQNGASNERDILGRCEGFADGDRGVVFAIDR